MDFGDTKGGHLVFFFFFHQRYSIINVIVFVCDMVPDFSLCSEISLHILVLEGAAHLARSY